MQVVFAYPADEWTTTRVDPDFLDESLTLESNGFEIYPVSLVANKIYTYGKVLQGKTVVYRGWMLTKQEYEQYVSLVEAKGGKVLVDTTQYLAMHHLPNWYHLIKELTAESVMFAKDSDIQREISELGWDKIFIKDYVKSLKTGLNGSLVSDLSEVPKVIQDMEHFRGQIEGGFVVRKAQTFFPDSEVRYFVKQGEMFAADPRSTPPPIVYEVAKRLAAYSPFFSVDIAITDNHSFQVVEVGDGQVSDIVGWTPERFAEIWS